jgi:hypothetical protein
MKSFLPYLCISYITKYKTKNCALLQLLVS